MALPGRSWRSPLQPFCLYHLAALRRFLRRNPQETQKVPTMPPLVGLKRARSHDSEQPWIFTGAEIAHGAVPFNA